MYSLINKLQGLSFDTCIPAACSLINNVTIRPPFIFTESLIPQIQQLLSWLVPLQEPQFISYFQKYCFHVLILDFNLAKYIYSCLPKFYSRPNDFLF